VRDGNLSEKRERQKQEARMRALPLTASRGVPAREVFRAGTKRSAREMFLRRRSNRGVHRRASAAKRVRCNPGLDQGGSERRRELRRGLAGGTF